MKIPFRRAALIAAFTCLAPVFAQDNPSAKPLNRDTPRHKQFVEIVNKNKDNCDVIFVGDSITQGWEGGGKKAWAENFAQFKPINLGISGDQTGHVIWRITDGKELEPIKPKLCVMMIGTNNTGGHSAEQIAGGIKTIIEIMEKQKPDMKILLLGVFPRSGAKLDKDVMVCPADKLNPKIKQINDIIAKYDDGKKVFYKDIGGVFLNKDGGLEKKIMYDYLHLTADGYDLWAKAIKADIEKLLK